VTARADRAVFLDRDGVLNALAVDPVSGRPESPYRPEDVRLTPGAAEALRLLRTLGVPLAVVSNQPAAAKGIATRRDLERVHQAVVELLAQEGVGVDVVRYCLHHPDGTDPDLTGACDCRKPAPGLILQAAEALGLDADALPRSWIIGDSDVDVRAGQAAGLRTVLVEEPRSAHRRGGDVRPDHRAPDVLEAARIVAAALSAPVPGEEAA
jgi:D-glycero-D-manno-heptose 1,7-bisphosphate phosphatase